MRLARIAIGVTVMVAASGMAVRPAWQWRSLPPTVSAPIVPNGNTISAAKVALGRRLFYDRMLSKDGSMACADCHQQARGFTDGQPVHRGVTGEMGIRNVPGLANVGWRTQMTWTNPGVATLEEQALIPMTGTKPVEMGLAGHEAITAERLVTDSCYRRLFPAAFPGAAKMDLKKIAIAISMFERTLISFGSPWDRKTALPLARRGAAQFHAAGCASCHSGVNFTDDKVHYVGTAALGEVDNSAYGGKALPPGFEPPAEQFRTPSLRNVEVTGPWLHDGSSASVEDAIRRHASAGLSNADMPALMAFLASLTDKAFLTDPKFGSSAPACPTAR